MTLQPLNADFVFGKLEVVDNPHADGPKTIEFVFNPSKLSVGASAKWDQPGQSGNKKAAAPNYNGAEPRTMDFDFILDGWDLSGKPTTQKDGRTKQRDVHKDIETLVSWTRPTKKAIGKNKPNPPTVELKWGPKWFPAYVASLKTLVTMFDKKGFPLRATVTVNLKEVPSKGADKPQNPTSGSRVGHQSHTFLAGDSLASIAQQYYDKPSYWRGVAAANDIDDPTRLRNGTRLYLPPLSDVAALS